MKMIKIAVAVLSVLATASAFSWPKDIVHDNWWELPPASREVVEEAARVRRKVASTLTLQRFVAHRGDCEAGPENTIPAIESAVKHRLNIEIDLYMTLDGKVYLTHDYDLSKRKCGVDKMATNVCWKGELEFADPGRSSGMKGLRYPLLDDVLAMVKDGTFIILEVKDPRQEKIMPLIKEAILRHPNVNASNVCLQNVNPDWIAYNLPGFRSFHCILPRKGWRVTDPPHDLFRMLEEYDSSRHQILTIRWDEDLVTEEFVKAAHSRGFKVCVWTVNDTASALAALGRGVDWVCSDRCISIWEEITGKKVVR